MKSHQPLAQPSARVTSPPETSEVSVGEPPAGAHQDVLPLLSNDEFWAAIYNHLSDVVAGVAARLSQPPRWWCRDVSWWHGRLVSIARRLAVIETYLKRGAPTTLPRPILCLPPSCFLYFFYFSSIPSFTFIFSQ